MSNDDLNDLQDRISRDLRSEKLWTKLWSLVHHLFLFGAAIISALAALILQLKTNILGIDYNTVGTVFAALAALLGTIAGAGGFRRKWQTNRLTRNRLDELMIDLTNPSCNSDKIREKLKEIWREHNKGIVGGT